MTLKWNKITDKHPEWKQSVLAFNVLGNLIIIEYWRHDLKDTITHWINKPKQPKKMNENECTCIVYNREDIETKKNRCIDCGERIE